MIFVFGWDYDTFVIVFIVQVSVVRSCNRRSFLCGFRPDACFLFVQVLLRPEILRRGNRLDRLEASVPIRALHFDCDGASARVQAALFRLRRLASSLSDSAVLFRLSFRFLRIRSAGSCAFGCSRLCLQFRRRRWRTGFCGVRRRSALRTVRFFQFSRNQARFRFCFRCSRLPLSISCISFRFI